MRYGIYAKYSLDMPHDSIQKAYVGYVNKERVGFFKQGQTFMPIRTEIFTQNADDVIQNRMTIRTLGEVYKIPRIANPLRRN